MTRQILIDNIVRQTMILIAQLATSGGVRSPLAQVADRVFLDLAQELDSQGISRSVSADMFGMALRSYRRRIRQLSESSTEHGRSLWEAVLDFLSRGSLVTREQLLRRFHRDEEALVKGVVSDLCESGLVFKLGTGKDTAYRAATADELAELRERSEGLSELVWVLVYREGPIDETELARKISLRPELLSATLASLVESGRVARDEQGRYACRLVVLAPGSSAGWEAGLFDHFQAVVKTMCARLRRGANGPRAAESGGSTYTFAVWAGHPLEEEARSFLPQFRERLSKLRQDIKDYNDQNPLPSRYDRVTVYGGVCVTSEEQEESEVENQHNV